MLKIAAACGNGMGSSLMVKMKIENVLRKLNVDGKVDHMSIGDAKNQASNYDVIVSSNALVHNFDNVGDRTAVIGLKNLLSEEEIEDKIKEAGVISSSD